MSTEPFIGEIKIFGFDFAPRGYLTCQGQILSIAQNSALYALIGTKYGGDGQITFALPNLQGRMPIGQGQGGGLSERTVGEFSGTENVSLLSTNLPSHIHTLNNVTVKLKASTANADENTPDGGYPATSTNPTYSSNGPTPSVYTGGTEITGTTDSTGNGLPFSVMNPYLVINYSIAIAGIFPSRD